MPLTSQPTLQVIHEDADFLAVNKPPGLLIHPTKPGGPCTLWDQLRALLAYELTTGGHLGIVNRLDRETSGLVFVAKTREAAACASKALALRQALKHYLALSFHHAPWEEQWVEAPLRRRGEFEPSPVYLQQAVHPQGVPAVTRFRKLSEGRLDGRPVTLLLATPHTGRTHQIRVHLAYLGLPIVGDKLYAGGPEAYLEFVHSGWTPHLRKLLHHPRHALHCAHMELCQRACSAPPPSDFLTLLQKAGISFTWLPGHERSAL